MGVFIEKKYIYITFDFIGFHNWPEASGESSYLREKHRHVFRGKMLFPVGHTNRDIEFISLKNEILAFLDTFNQQFGRKSCEDLCELLCIEFANCVQCEISEDGENGAVLIRKGV
jgi:hypothetical protein